MNDQLFKLYALFDSLYEDILPYCVNCKDHDCKGFVWLLKKEADLLFEKNTPILEINDGIFFIHSFEEIDGEILINKPKPPCVLKKENLCSLYKNRPLVCRMYPVGFAVVNDEISIVLHSDCNFSRCMSKAEKNVFFQKVIEILRRIPANFFDEIVTNYANVCRISTFPDGINDVEVITPIRLI